MSSDYMSVDTGALDRHAKNLEDHVTDARVLYERFNKSLAALGEPWGEGDSYAESFREWYAPAHQDLLNSLQTAGAMLEQVHVATTRASSLYKQAADNAQQAVGELAREVRTDSGQGTPTEARVGAVGQLTPRVGADPAGELAPRVGVDAASQLSPRVGTDVGDLSPRIDQPPAQQA
ncbi:hypothetical protein BX265_6878 [Streptomyces sp. TLI_235]|nr:hypothetical protein [Streptomyces sp. TLI_235]PBC69549.1 hypothetical protein BX265_6878 [Streptomyces sp. TLI_235]